jgi:uncharacterized membrane protein
MVIHIKMASAVFFYVAYLVGLVIFAVSPLLRLESGLLAAVFGLFLCGITYGGYSYSPLRILNGWTIALTWVDVVWGILIGVASAMAGFYISRLLAEGY